MAECGRWRWAGMFCLWLLLFESGFSGTVEISWRKNRKSDYHGYRIHYGTLARKYTFHRDVGDITHCTIEGLEKEVEYFFAVTAYDSAKNECTYSEKVAGILKDSQPLALANATSLNPTILALEFNKKIARATAAELTNYAIDQNIQLQSATLLSDGKNVHLKTSEHRPGQKYTFTINKIQDISHPANTIADHTVITFDYTGAPGDQTGPVPLLVNVDDSGHIEILFNEAINPETAETESNYQILDQYHNPLPIYQAFRHETDPNLAHLHTAMHHAGVVYSVSCTGIQDRFGNQIKNDGRISYQYNLPDLLGPTVRVINAIDPSQIDILFNEKLDRLTAEDIANYSIDKDVMVFSASLNDSQNLVHLKTREHGTDEPYGIRIGGVRDKSPQKNIIAPRSNWGYRVAPADSLGPLLARVDVLDAQNLALIFNEALAPTEVESPDLYQIDHGVQALNAFLHFDRKKIELFTSLHQPGFNYTLSLKGLRDASPNHNKILFNTIYSYSLPGDNVAPTIVQVEAGSRSVCLKTSGHQAGQAYVLSVSGLRDLNNNLITSQTDAYTLFPGLELRLQSRAETESGLLELNRPYYLDRDNVITKVPRGFEFMHMVRTRIDDKEINTDAFLRLHLAQKALVYVAYDSRAIAFPAWLSNNFTRTPMHLEVTDKCKRLELWGAVVPAGEILLGGNLAAGAGNAKSMYIVLMTEMPANFRSIMDNPLALEEELAANLPERVDLRQNYPNPFNPTTIIGFRVPGDCRVKIEIFNVLG